VDRLVRPPRSRARPHLALRVRAERPGQTYAGYTRVFMGPKVARQRALKADVLRTKKELQQTSAQDQFAKWAKLRRSVDKGLADLEKLSASRSQPCTSPPS
jgi:hypothetical protein